jgi:hypothetical protein
VSNASGAAALYYSFYVRAERRFSNGLSILGSYTWSRDKDDIAGASSAGASNIVQIAGPQNAYNLAVEWSLATQNVPDRFTMSATYELPFGKGKKYLTGNNWLNYAVGGCSLNTFGLIQSGFPLQVTQSNSNSLIGASYQRPNATGAVFAATSRPASRARRNDRSPGAPIRAACADGETSHDARRQSRRKRRDPGLHENTG